jgi:excisionase family DNA binding protein
VKYELSYTIDGLAAAVGISRWSIHDAMKKGEIPFFKIGRRTFIHKNDAKEWIKKFEVRRGHNKRAA